MASASSSDMTALCQRARPEILAMAGYVSARSLELPGSETVFLDANECAFEPFVGATGLSRYPAQQPAPSHSASLCVIGTPTVRMRVAPGYVVEAEVPPNILLPRSRRKPPPTVGARLTGPAVQRERGHEHFCSCVGIQL